MNDSEQKRRMEIERFVCRENVARFRRLLTTYPNEEERKMLISLLAEEQEKQIRVGTGRDWSSPEGEPFCHHRVSTRPCRLQQLPDHVPSAQMAVARHA